MSDERYIVMTVECSHCKAKQKIHVNARTEAVQINGQVVRCLRCEKHFLVTDSYKIIRGPFPA